MTPPPRTPGTNSGHGHVWKRPDGWRLDCGGPAMCEDCADDQATVQERAKIMTDRCSSETARATKTVYVKRWRTLVELPAKYADEIVAALRTPAITGQGEAVAMLGGVHGVTLIRHIEAMLPEARTEYHTPLYKAALASSPTQMVRIPQNDGTIAQTAQIIIDRLLQENAELRAAPQAQASGVAQGSRHCDAKAYVERAIASYVGDPADNQFQKGYLAALEVVRDEAFTCSVSSTEGK